MNPRTYQLIIVASTTFATMALTYGLTTMVDRHLAITHHAAHYESNSWGVTSFVWHDEYAQTPVADPVNDSLIPPPIKK